MTYTYDSLNRRATAQTADPTWGQSYDYDGFRNLTYQHVTKGTAPDGAEPQIGGVDGNGNATGIPDPNGSFYLLTGWDVENRLTAVGSFGPSGTRYAYAPDNKRVWRGVWDGSGTQTVDEITFWSVTGQRVGTYDLVSYGSTLRALTAPYPGTGTEYYFGGKLVKNISGYVHADRLGTIGKYFPYGQERPSATTNGTEKFATYFRDSDTGLDYADQRYHAPGQGRFLTVDRTWDSVTATDPSSWNGYSYVLGDPVNLNDESGLVACGDLRLGLGTVGEAALGNNTVGHYIDLVWHEAGVLAQASGNVQAWTDEFGLIAQAIWNRFQIVSGTVSVTGADGIVYGGSNASILGYGLNGSSLNSVLINAAAGTPTPVLDSQTGALVDNLNGLNGDLNQEQGDTSINSPGRIGVLGTNGPLYLTQGCYSVVTAIQAVNGITSGSLSYNTASLFVTSWNSGGRLSKPNGGREVFLGSSGPSNFYGFTSDAFHFSVRSAAPGPVRGPISGGHGR